LFASLVGSGALALGRLAPRGDRVTGARGAAFTAAMWVVDRVHRNAANVGTATEPATATGLAQAGVRVIRVRDRAHGRKAGAVHQALLARIQTQDRPAGIAAHILGIGTGGTGDLTALAGLHLDVVHDGADRHALERHRVARLHVDRIGRGDHLVAGAEALGREDIGLLAVLIGYQRDERGPVGIVFQALHRADHVELGALEI